MADHVVDTNVLKVASHADPTSPWKKSDHVPRSQREIVLDWLKAFRADAERQMVLDRKKGIYDEYRGRHLPANERMTDQDFGMQVLIHKMQMGQVAYVDVQYDHNGHALVVEGLLRFDNSDKKMIAAHLRHKEDGNACTIVNSADTDWHEHEGLLKDHDVEVEQLMGKWCLDKVYAKYPERTPPGWVFTDWAKEERTNRGVPAPRKGK